MNRIDLEAHGFRPGLIGYARESVRGRPLADQLHALEDAGCSTVFAETLVGRTADRPQLAACLASLRPGNTLVIPSLGRFGRSLHELVRLVADLQRHEIDLWALDERLDTRSRDGQLVFLVFDALAGLVTDIRLDGPQEGRAAARAAGQRLGRPPLLTTRQIAQARQLLLDPGATVSSVARKVGTSRSTLYRALPELTGRQTTKPSASPASPLSPRLDGPV